MSARIFVDTNILLYARDRGEKQKQGIAQACLEQLWEQRNGCVSVQVLNEFYVNATQKLKPGLTRNEAWEDVEALLAWDPVVLDMPLVGRGFVLQSRYDLSFWDALIVAAAERAGCAKLLSEDFAEGAIYAGVQICNPFKEASA